MPDNKRYLVTGEVTISIHTYVMARSKREAIRLAKDIPLPAIHHSTHQDPEDESLPGFWEEWRTSGELDGEPNGLSAEVDNV